jgi:glycosyltransferase involved in cell wall biosynthesis
MTTADNMLRLAIPFNTSGSPYGMERAVIELFDSLRPRVAGHFLMSQTMRRESLPVLAEVRRRGLAHSFLSDTHPWPTFGKQRSLRQACRLLISLLKGNRDVLKATMRCDGVYLPGIRYSLYALLACVYCLLTGKRVIYQFHELTTYRSSALLVLRFLVRDFIHNTETGRRIVSETNPCVLKRRNHVIPLVLQLADEQAPDDLPETLTRGKRAILFAGQVSPHKGIDLLLDAIALLDDYSDTVLIVIGACPSEFQSCFDALMRDERLRQRVVRLGYREDPLRFMACAYVYVHPTPPSRFLEAFGRSALEAMACGVPTVCFRAGAIQDVVVHGETGLICDREDAECLAENLKRFLDDPDFRDRCGAQAKARVDAVYSAQRVSAEWKRLLEAH